VGYPHANSGLGVTQAHTRPSPCVPLSTGQPFMRPRRPIAWDRALTVST
jgi:hypothetical protein